MILMTVRRTAYYGHTPSSAGNHYQGQLSWDFAIVEEALKMERVDVGEEAEIWHMLSRIFQQATGFLRWTDAKYN